MKTKQQQKQQNTIYNGRNGQINLDDHNNNEDDDYDVKNYDGEITVLTTKIITIIMGRIINVNHNNYDRVNTIHNNNNIYDGSDNVDKYGNTNNGE